MRRELLPLLLIALTAFCGCSDDTPSPATATPPATISPGATPTAEARTIELGTAVSALPNTVIFTVSGCYQCDGPDTLVQRHTTDSSGTTSTETILQSGVGPLEGLTIGLAGAVADGSMLWAVTCSTDYCGGLGNHPNDRWRIVWSFDGGRTWGVAWDKEAAYLTVQSASAGRLVAEVIVPGGPPSTALFFVVARSGVSQVTPPQAAGQFPEAVLLRDGSVLWVETADNAGSRHRILRPDGTALGVGVGPEETIGYQSVFQLDDGSLAVGFLDRGTGSYGLDLFPGTAGPQSTSFTASGARRFTVTGAYRFSASSLPYVLANATGDTFGLNDLATSYPVLVDLNSQKAIPIVADVFTAQRGRNRFIAFSRLP